MNKKFKINFKKPLVLALVRFELNQRTEQSRSFVIQKKEYGRSSTVAASVKRKLEEDISKIYRDFFN